MDKVILQKEIIDIRQKVDNLETLITEKFQHLEQLLNNKFGHLEEKNLNHVNQSLQKMNNHIDFIHETYSTLQTPLNYVKGQVEYLMGYEPTPSLPSITNTPSNLEKDI
jgi:hypothetical protein